MLPGFQCTRLPACLAFCAHHHLGRPLHRVLEVGSGSGYVVCSVALMLQHLGRPACTLAIDHSLPAVEATRQTLHNHKARACCWSAALRYMGGGML